MRAQPSPCAALSRRLVSLALAASLASASTLAAQEALLTGRVTDATNGASLAGTQVTIVENGRQAVTDRQGNYLIAGLPAGEYRVQFSYLGFDPRTETVQLTAGRRATLDVVLGNETVVMKELYVTSLRDAQAAALNQQRAAPNLTNVVSSDSIGRFPDPNVAEALQRVVGIGVERDQGEGRYINIRGAPIEFTAVTIDGVSVPSPEPTTRAINLDVLPSDVVRAVEVTKALLPEQDADSIAGAVNIRTESPFDNDGLHVRGMAGASYNELGGTHDSRASLTVSNTFGATRAFGVLVSASYSKTRRQLDNVENVWIYRNRPEGGQVATIEETLFKDYDTRRERRAVTTALDWRPTPASRLYFRYTYSEFTDDEFRNRLGFQWADGVLQPGATNTAATYNNIRLSKQFRHRTLRNEINSLVAGGDAQVGRLSLDAAVTLAKSVQDYPNRNELLYRTSNNIAASYDIAANPNEPRYSVFQTGQHLELNRYSFRENTFRTNDTSEEEAGFQANGTLPLEWGGPNTSLRLGLKVRDKEKSADEERFRNRQAAAAPAQGITGLLGTVPSRNFSYVLGNKFDPTLVNAYLAGARSASPRRDDASTTADYAAEERLVSSYGSLNYDFGALDVVAGVRVENTRFEGSAPRFNTNTGAVTPQRVKRSYTDWFPSLHARYTTDERLVWRAAVSRGIARPNFTEIVPRVVDTTEGAGSRVTVSQGNPQLEPTRSTNLDVMVEYYMQPLGLLSAGVFYKDVDDFIFTATSTGTFNGLPATISRPENARGGEIRGFEVAFQQQFSRLPGLLGGFGIYANYTWTDSSVEAPFIDPSTGLSTRFRRVALPGQSKTTYNLAVFFERRGFNARLAYTDRSDYLDEIDVERGADSDLYWEGRGQLDLIASYQLTRHLGLFTEWKNITNTAGVRYTGIRSQVEEYEKFGYTVFGGVKFNF